MNELPEGIKEIENDIYVIDSKEYVEEDSDPSFSDEDRTDSENINNFAWYYNCRKVLCSISFHTSFPNPPHLAIGGCNDKLILFSLKEGDKASTREFQENETVSSTRYSADGKYLAYGTIDGFITILTTKNDINDYSTYARFEGPQSIEFLKWHEDKNLLLILGTETNIWCWYEDTITVLITSSIPMSGSFFSDLSLAISCQDGTINHWNNITTNNQCTVIFTPEILDASSQTIEYCNGLLAVGQSNGRVFLVNPTKKVIEGVYQLHNDSVESISYYPTNPKDKIVASSSIDGSIYLWNLDTGAKILHIENIEDKAGVTQLIWHPHSYIIIAGYTDGSICVYNCNDGKLLVKRRPHSGPVMDLTIKTISHTQSLIGSVGHDGSARIWLLKS